MLKDSSNPETPNSERLRMVLSPHAKKRWIERSPQGKKNIGQKLIRLIRAAHRTGHHKATWYMLENGCVFLGKLRQARDGVKEFIVMTVLSETETSLSALTLLPVSARLFHLEGIVKPARGPKQRP